MKGKSEMSLPRIAAVVGPTASGKTALSVAVAKRCRGEIVCLDSMQIYSGMEIGTAAPTEEEKCGVPHHLFGFADPRVPFSCTDYAALAGKVIGEITERGSLPILVGGTGLYLDSLLFGCGDASAAPDAAYREELFSIAEREGNEALHAMLRKKDPEAAEAIHPNNVKRVVRALEICRACGTKSDYDRRSRGKARYELRGVYLCFEDRGLLYSRIDKRVDAMIGCGLADETRHLLATGALEPGTTASQAIGYKELIPYLRGEETLAEASEKLKTATRRYAKRQITWFSGKDYLTRLTADGLGGREGLNEAVDITARLFSEE